MVDRLAVIAEAAGAVGHQALALGGAHRAAQVGLAGLAEFALAAFGGIQRNHVIADLHRSHALTDRFDHTAALVTENAGKYAFAVLTGQGVGIGMANTGGNNANQHLASLRRRNVHFNNLQGFIRRKGYGGPGLDHGILHWMTEVQAGKCSRELFRG